MQFSFNYKHNLLEIKEIVIENIIKNKIDIDSIAKNAGYRNADDMITNIISKEKLGVIIPIDEVSNELRELKSLFRFDIELLQFKKFFNDDEYIYLYDKFNDDINNDNISINSEPDTIIVPAAETGFKKEFLENNRWFAINIGINMLEKLQYIAIYQKSPVKAITYYAKIANIDLYKDTGKYIIYFNGQAKKLKNSIPLNPLNPRKAPQSRVYTNIERILSANNKTTLDDIF